MLALENVFDLVTQLTKRVRVKIVIAGSPAAATQRDGRSARDIVAAQGNEISHRVHQKSVMMQPQTEAIC